VPLPGSKYCPSHKHLDEELDFRIEIPEPAHAQAVAA
jgi:hypothetical protein